MLKLSGASTVAILTVPSIFWLCYRIGEILWRQHKALKHHIGQAFSSNTTTRQGHGIVAFAAHVFTGLPLLLAAPYLAYLLVPSDRLFRVEDAMSPTTLLLMGVVGSALVVANASAFLWILPHPSRYQAYKVDQRSFVRALGILYVASLQFTAMGLSACMLLVGNHVLQLIVSCLVPAMYLWTIAICFCEISNPNFAWEYQFWARPILAKLGHGLKSKSKVTSAFLGGVDERRGKAVQYLLYSIFCAAGLLAFVQSVAMLQYCLYPSKVPVPRTQELFFVIFVLYMTIVMSAGFFTMIQTIFDGEKRPNDAKLVAEVMLTQAIPVLLLYVGPAWIGIPSFSEFIYRFIFWSSS